MFSLERIFLPLDLSQGSRAALALALELGQPHPQLHVAHVLPAWQPPLRQILFPYAALGEDDVELEHELIQAAQQLLMTRFELDPNVLAAPPHVAMGQLRQTLPALLRQSDAQLVIMGACGESGPEPESLGSTAACVLRHAMQPVLLVRQQAHHPTITRIVCALDLSPQSDKVLSAALGLAIRAHADLEIIHVLPDPLAHDTHNILRQQIKFNPRQVLDRARDKIEALFDRAMQSVQVPYPARVVVDQLWKQRHILMGDPARQIIERAEAIQADVIVLGSRDLQHEPSPTLGQVCWSIARRATCHVLVVPIEQDAALLSPEEGTRAAT